MSTAERLLNAIIGARTLRWRIYLIVMGLMLVWTSYVMKFILLIYIDSSESTQQSSVETDSEQRSRERVHKRQQNKSHVVSQVLVDMVKEMTVTVCRDPEDLCGNVSVVIVLILVMS